MQGGAYRFCSICQLPQSFSAEHHNSCAVLWVFHPVAWIIQCSSLSVGRNLFCILLNTAIKEKKIISLSAFLLYTWCSTWQYRLCSSFVTSFHFSHPVWFWRSSSDISGIPVLHQETSSILNFPSRPKANSYLSPLPSSNPMRIQSHPPLCGAPHPFPHSWFWFLLFFLHSNQMTLWVTRACAVYWVLAMWTQEKDAFGWNSAFWSGQ